MAEKEVARYLKEFLSEWLYCTSVKEEISILPGDKFFSSENSYERYFFDVIISHFFSIKSETLSFTFSDIIVPDPNKWAFTANIEFTIPYFFEIKSDSLEEEEEGTRMQREYSNIIKAKASLCENRNFSLEFL